MKNGKSLRFAISLATALSIMAVATPGKAAVKDVTCANTTTDTTTLNNAISGSSVGDDIRIHGQCLINRTIILYPTRTYEGDSREGTMITQASGSNLQAMLASQSWSTNSRYADDGIRIAHLGLDGNSSANTGTIGLAIRSWLTVLEDLYIQNTSGDGIRLTNASATGTELEASSGAMVGGRISNCFITNSGGNGIRAYDSQNNVTDWDLTGTAVAASGLSAIYLDNTAGWRITGNHIYGISQYGIYAQRMGGSTIDQNYVEDFGDSGGSTTWYGIAAAGIQPYGSASVISGNKVFQFNTESSGTSYVYIGITGVNSGMGVVNVVNNTIVGAGGAHDTGLSYVLDAGSSLKVVSANNNVQSVTTARSVGAGVTLATAY